MSPQNSTSQSKFYSLFALLIVTALLSVGCERSLGYILPTPIPPSYTSNPALATPTTGTGSSTSLAPISSLTSIPASPTSEAPLATSTSVPPSTTPEAPLAGSTPIPPSTTPESPLAPSTSITPSATVESPLVLPTAVLPGSTPQPTTTTGPAAGNILFAPGTTAAIVQGTLQPGQILSYTLAAAQSQPLILIMDSPNNDVSLGVFEPDGTILLNPANKWTSWQVTLPLTGLYRIQVTGGALAESYTLTVKVAQVVNFASGTTSSNLNGTTTNGYLFSYGLNCSAGQTMTVNLYVPSGTAYLDIFGITTGTLLSNSIKATTWTGVLPQTQDYVIEVVPSNNQVVNYVLAVSVTGNPGGNSSTGGNIVFAPGTTAAVNQGTVQPGQVVKYTVQASQLQPMILLVDSPNHDVTLGVLYPNGGTFLSPDKKWTYWQWQLPETGLYTIQVIGGATAEQYTLTTKIARLVSFPSGSNSVTLNGDTTKGYIVSYAFNFKAGDVLTVTLNGDSSKAYLDIFGLVTGSLLSPSVKATTWTVSLPQTQSYVVEVIPRDGYVGSYSLTVSVP